MPTTRPTKSPIKMHGCVCIWIMHKRHIKILLQILDENAIKNGWDTEEINDRQINIVSAAIDSMKSVHALSDEEVKQMIDEILDEHTGPKEKTKEETKEETKEDLAP